MTAIAVRQSLLEAAHMLAGLGFSFGPTKNKTPVVKWKEFQDHIPTLEQYEGWFENAEYGLAVIGGRVSGNLEILDFDVVGIYERFAARCVAMGFEALEQSCVLESTPSGGRHLYYRSSCAVSGSKALARRMDEDNKPDILIETRGEGGSAQTYPTYGYETLRSSFADMPVLTEEERDTLHTIARMFDEMPPVVKPEYPEREQRPRSEGDPLRPGDDYNERGPYEDILEAAGWTRLRTHDGTTPWKRPGKTGPGLSATTGHMGRRLFTVFSSNAHPFSNGEHYKPFEVYALLKHGGDYTEAARELGKQGYGEQAITSRATAHEVQSKVFTATDGTAAADNDGKGPPSDITLAEAWADEVKTVFRYVEGDQWWKYEGGCWRYSSSEEATRGVQLWLMARRETDKKTPVTSAKVRNVLFLAKSLLGPHSMKEFDPNPFIIPLQNGVYDINSKKLLPHSPAHLLTHQSPFEYNSDATCPTWERCLSEWMLQEDRITHLAEWVTVLQEWFGYCLIPDMRAQLSMIWVGDGANGKGTSTRVLEQLVGVDYTTSVPIEQLHDPYHRAELHGKLVGFINEPDPKAMQKNGHTFKQIVGGDRLSARRPTEKPFNFKPTCRLVISCNAMPSTKDLSHGYFRRFIVIDWRHNVPEANKKLNLDDLLRDELPGIFNWCLKGLERLKANSYKFSPSAESKKLIEKYKHDEDPLARFIEEKCERLPDLWVSSKRLYTAYTRWCEDFSERRLSLEEMGRRLGKMDLSAKPRRDKGEKQPGRGWEGIALRTEDDDGEGE